MYSKEELVEIEDLLGSIENKCEIAGLILVHPDSHHLLFTILEDLVEDAQALVLNYCVMQSSKPPSKPPLEKPTYKSNHM